MSRLITVTQDTLQEEVKQWGVAVGLKDGWGTTSYNSNTGYLQEEVKQWRVAVGLEDGWGYHVL